MIWTKATFNSMYVLCPHDLKITSPTIDDTLRATFRI